MELLNMFFGIFLISILGSALIIVPYVIWDDIHNGKGDK